MAYTLISSQTLSSTAASITFSSIPSTYKDLAVRVSARGTEAATFGLSYITLNGLSTSVYSITQLSGNGATASSSLTAATTRWSDSYIPDANATANTFGSFELYLPNYTNSSANKPISNFFASETNAATAYMGASAYLFNSTAAITSITFAIYTATSYATGSSFYLYGIN
jgi:hypothetical protein